MAHICMSTSAIQNCDFSCFASVTVHVVAPTLHHLLSIYVSLHLYWNDLLCVSRSFAQLSFSFPSFTQDNGHHQVESHIRKKLDSLLKESRIGDKEDSDSFSIRALLRATHQGLQKNLRQVNHPEAMCGAAYGAEEYSSTDEEKKEKGWWWWGGIKLGHGISHTAKWRK